MYPKSKTASPTVSTVALMLTILIDAYKQRDVATADVAGAYLKATMNDYVLIKFVGESVDILLKMEPSYKKFVTYEKGVKVATIRTTQESTLRMRTIGSAMVQPIPRHIENHGFHHQPIQPLCGKLHNRRFTMYHCVVRGRHKNIAR